MSAPTAPRNAIPEPDHILLQARNVEFDWSNLPMHWIPGDPFSTHVLNVLHLLLPAGEEWFVETFKEALPLIEDEQLRDDVVGFIGQEAMHANAHTGVLVHLKEKGLDPTPFTEQMEWTFSKILGPRPLTGLREKNYLIERLAVIAAIEHITAFLGDWVLNAEGLDRAGMHPTMLDLLRWHGAEEVEHRAVAFDLYQHIDGSYIRRVVPYAVVAPMIVWLWMIVGTRHLLRNDPTTTQQLTLMSYLKAAGKGLLPTVGQLLAVVPGYLRPDYNPSSYGNTSQAVAYLASSPAAQAAEAEGH